MGVWVFVHRLGDTMSLSHGMHERPCIRRILVRSLGHGGSQTPNVGPVGITHGVPAADAHDVEWTGVVADKEIR